MVLNLIRMNLFRMIHTKCVIVVFVLLMGFSVISGCMSAYDSKEMVKEIEKQKEEDKTEIRKLTKQEEEEIKKKAAMEEAAKKEAKDNGEDSATYEAGYEFGEQMSENVGIYINTPVDGDGNLKDYVFMYCSELSSCLLLMFILIGAVLFFRGDEKDGFLKNIAGQTKHRYNIFFARLITVGIYTFVCMLCYMCVEYLAFKFGFIMEGSINFGINYLPEAIKIFALQYLLHMAFISGLLLITEVTKSTAAGLTIGLLGVMGFGFLFASIVQKIFHIGFDLNKYFINTNISHVNMGAAHNTIVFALGIGIVFFILYNVLNVLWFSRRDIV